MTVCSRHGAAEHSDWPYIFFGARDRPVRGEYVNKQVVALGMAPPALILFGVVDAAAATWTVLALGADQAAT